MREGQLPTDNSIPGCPRIAHADLVAWMETRGFPVPQPKRPPVPRQLAVPAPFSAAHQQRRQEPGRIEPVVDIALEPTHHMEVPGVALIASGWCLNYHPDDEGWLANTDEAIEEAEVSVCITTTEMRALASALLKMADELDAPAAATPASAVAHVPLTSPVEACSTQLLELAEAAQRFGIGPHLLRAEIRAGRLPAYKFGSRYRLSLADLAAWLESKRA